MKRIDDIREPELIRRFQGGESWAFDRLMEMHQQRVYRIALGMLGDHDSAADLVQEVFVRAFRAMQRFEARSKLSTWLHRVTVNLATSELRKRKLRQSLSLSDFSNRLRSAIGRPSRDLESRQIGEQIEAAVSMLPPRQRAVFVMRHDGEMSHSEIAEALNLSVGAVRVNYYHALRKLREELKDHE